MFQHENYDISKKRKYFCTKFCSFVYQTTVHKFWTGCWGYMSPAQRGRGWSPNRKQNSMHFGWNLTVSENFGTINDDQRERQQVSKAINASYAAAFARVNVLSISHIFGAHRHWNSEMCFFLLVIVYLFPVGLVSHGVNIVAERLDGLRRSLAIILQDCKFFSLEIVLHRVVWAPIGVRALRLQPHQPHGWSGHEFTK